MKKPIVGERQMQRQLSDIVAKLVGIGELVRQQNELLRRLCAEREPEYRPSSHGALLTAREHPAATEHEKSRRVTNSIASDLHNTPIRRFDNPPVRVHPTLGSL